MGRSSGGRPPKALPPPPPVGCSAWRATGRWLEPADSPGLLTAPRLKAAKAEAARAEAEEAARRAETQRLAEAS